LIFHSYVSHYQRVSQKQLEDVPTCLACKDAPKLIPLMVLAGEKAQVLYGNCQEITMVSIDGFIMIIMGISVENQ